MSKCPNFMCKNHIFLSFHSILHSVKIILSGAISSLPNFNGHKDESREFGGPCLQHVRVNISHFCFALCIKTKHNSGYLAIVACFLCISQLLTMQIAYFMADTGTGVHLQHVRVHITHFCYALCIKTMH